MPQKISSFLARVFSKPYALPAVLAAAAVLLYAVAASLLPAYNTVIAVAVIVLYAAAVCTAAVRRGKGKEKKNGDERGFGAGMMNVASKLRLPAVITDTQGRIIWYNDSMAQVTGKSDKLYGSPITEYTADSAESVTLSEDGAEGIFMIGERSYAAQYYTIGGEDRKYRFVLLDDNTEFLALKDRYRAERTAVMLIIIDNIDELLQFVQENYRAVATEVEQTLKSFASELGGVVREYERDKYMLICDDSAIETCTARKFDILERVKETRVGETSLPVTISVGVARIDGSIEERERAAQSALDTALQRGGDQAVLKTADGVEFYGGRSKPVQKRTKVRARIVATELCTQMSASDNVLVMGHRNPDFDSVGSAVGIARLAMFCGIEVNIIIDPADQTAATCVSQLSGEGDYSGVFIDPETALDRVRSNTLLVVTDVNNPALFLAPDIVANVGRRVFIDHHRVTADNDTTAKVISYIEPSASSTCELVAEILEQGLPTDALLPCEANLLYAGIILDTKRFSKNTGTRTFSAALYLHGRGASPAAVDLLFNEDVKDVRREAEFERNVEIYRGVIAVTVFDTAIDSDVRISAAKAADKLLRIRGVKASFAIVGSDGKICISARSYGEINVQLVLERFGGGGHFGEAGAQVSGKTAAEVRDDLKAVLDEYLEKGTKNA